jgi:hypothetical protein
MIYRGIELQLVINSYGSYLRKSGNCFLVKIETENYRMTDGDVDRSEGEFHENKD